MGLIKAAVEAVGSTFHDQWKDYIRCEDLGNDILMKKVSSQTGVISKNSAIQVGVGQIAVIFQSGKVLDATAEPGVYTFDASTSPTFFAGQFGAVFKEMWNRFTYGGAVSQEQAVFYLNAKEIMDNKFGTPAPVPFQDWSHAIPNQMTGSMNPMSVSVKCFGKYTFRINDPALFMSKVAGIAEEYRKDALVEQMRAEVISAFQNVLNELGNSNHKVPVLELPSSTDEIKTIMDQKVFDEQIRSRGLSLVSFVVESVTLDDASQTKINNYELSSNSYMQQGTLVGSYAEAVKDAANNSAGAMNGFMGVGMMNMASNGMIGGTAANVFNNANNASHQAYDPYANGVQQPVQPTPVVSEQSMPQTEVSNVEQATQEQVVPMSFCPNCGTKTTGGNFCGNCGTKLN